MKDIQRNRETERLTDKQTYRETGRHRGWLTEIQRNRETD